MTNLVLDVKFENEGAEAVALPEVKSWLKIDVSDDDQILSMLIPASRQRCEGFTNISFITRTVTAHLQIGLGEIRLPYGPVKSVTSVTDTNDTTIQNYILVKYEVFKALDPYPMEVVAVYDATPDIDTDTLSELFKTALLADIAWLYTNRGDGELAGQLSPVAKGILQPYRRVV